MKNVYYCNGDIVVEYANGNKDWIVLEYAWERLGWLFDVYKSKPMALYMQALVYGELNK